MTPQCQTTTTTATTTKAAPRTTAASYCSRGGNWEQWDGIHGASRQWQAGTNDKGKENKKTQEMSCDVSWAVGKFFFFIISLFGY
jgi:hypothetical protein